MRKLILVFLCGILLSSCGANKFLTSSIPSTEINEIAYFEPIAYISLIEKSNKTQLNDSLSNLTTLRLDSIIKTNKRKYRISKKIEPVDSITKQKLNAEITYLIEKTFLSRQIDNILLTPTIDSLMLANNTRFAIATVTSGFGRRKGNYGGQVAKGAAIGILTLGMYTPVPIKSNITINTVIFDSKNKNIAFYRQSPLKEKSPTNPEVLTKEFEWIFEGYLYSNK